MTDWFNYLIDSIVNIFAHLILDIREIAWDFFLFCFSKLLELGGWANGFVVSHLPVFDASTHWSSVPAYIIQFLNYMHFGQCLTIVILAMIVRFTLNLIPFFRI